VKQKYRIKKCLEQPQIDADWHKSFWRDIESIKINLSHWPVQSEHIPYTEAKLQYDAAHLYVIFRVHDCYVRAVTSQINGEVWKDSCVEFFFAPNPDKPYAYFNLEANCCGILLAQCHTGPRQNSRFLDVEDCHRINIDSSASGPIRNEIAKSLTWTLEYVVPFELLARYADIMKPVRGVTWYGNFYKCADDCSYPHWMAWSSINSEELDFHRPDYFGVLTFI
jgi:hypothetical protein